MDVRVELWRQMSTEELMLLNCWRRLLRVSSTERRSNQSILKEISPGCSLEGTLKLHLSWNLSITKAETPVLWPPHAKSWLIGKDYDAGRDWGQEKKGTTEDEMAGWHHWLDGHESEWTPGVDDGQGGLVCCDSWGCKESNTTEWLIWSGYPTAMILSSNSGGVGLIPGQDLSCFIANKPKQKTETML